MIHYELASIVVEAKLILTTDEANPPTGWGVRDPDVAAYLLSESFTEGDGDENGFGTEKGVTYKCATDTDIANPSTDCESTPWNGGSASTAARTALAVEIRFEDGVSVVEWDVTGDVQAALADGATEIGWLLKKKAEGRSGQIVYYSKDYSPALGYSPRLVIEFASNVAPVSAQRQTVMALGDLQDIVESNPNTPLADKIEDARAKVEAAFDELAKAPPDNQAAIGNIEGAVGDLEAAVDAGLLDAVTGTQLMDDLSAIARLLAASALEEVAYGGDPGVLDDAQAALADGDALRTDGAFKDAVGKYKDALAKAESLRY